MNTTGNTILITGATSGIGRAMALRLATLGNQILAVGRNEEQLEALKAHSLQIQPFRADLTQSADVDALVVWVEQHFANLNVLINNAGVQYNYNVAQASGNLGQINAEVTLNLTAPLQLTSLLLPQLLTQPEAAVVNVTSGLGLEPKQSAPVYCATKAGLHIYSKALGYQLAGTSVRVMEVIAALVDTPMTAGRGSGKLSPDQLVDAFLEGFAQNRREINIGRVGLLRLMQRLSPALAARIMKNG